MVAASNCSHAVDIGSSNCYDTGERFGTIYLHSFLGSIYHQLLRKKISQTGGKKERLEIRISTISPAFAHLRGNFNNYR
jgi:hypothetical protein